MVFFRWFFLGGFLLATLRHQEMTMTMTLSSDLTSPSGLAHMPVMAEVRSPDVLHPQDGPCDCLSQPIQVRLLFYSILLKQFSLQNTLLHIFLVSPPPRLIFLLLITFVFFSSLLFILSLYPNFLYFLSLSLFFIFPIPFLHPFFSCLLISTFLPLFHSCTSPSFLLSFFPPPSLSVADPDPHHFGKLDPDPHQSER